MYIYIYIYIYIYMKRFYMGCYEVSFVLVIITFSDEPDS